MAKSQKQAGTKAKADAAKAGVLTSTVAVQAHEVEVTDLTATDTGKSIEVGGPPTKAAPFKTLGELDEYGFGSKTQSSFLLAHLEEGTYTKTQILDSFINHFRMDSDGKVSNDPKDTLDTARKKSSASVFFSDVVKPFGTYHASRSLIILTDETTKIMTLEPKRAALVKRAVADGILNSLKGFNMKKHADKVKVVLKKYGLPVE